MNDFCKIYRPDKDNSFDISGKVLGDGEEMFCVKLSSYDSSFSIWLNKVEFLRFCATVSDARELSEAQP